MIYDHFTLIKFRFLPSKDPIIITPQRGNKQFTVENAVLLLHRCSHTNFNCHFFWRV